nr:MAG TPA_asm: hypothetical protein [Caudoviricetes sp.]
MPPCGLIVTVVKAVQIGEPCDGNTEGSGNTPRREQRDLATL